MAIRTEQEKESIVNDICSLISEGSSLNKAIPLIVEKYGKFERGTFYDWIDLNQDWRHKYARAIETRAEVKFESIEADYLEQPQRDPETGKIDTGWVQLQRLKIDAKKWELSKLNPRKYGEKVNIDHTTQGEKLNQIDLTKYTDEELKLIAELQRKGGTGEA